MEDRRKRPPCISMERSYQMNYTNLDSTTSFLNPPTTFNMPNPEVLRITADGRMICGEGLSMEEATQKAAKLLIASFNERIQEMVDARIAAMTARAE